MNLIILNLSRNTTQDELIELFKECVTVESCELVMDKYRDESKGFGFISMSTEDEAMNAISSLNGKEVDGYKLKVKVSTRISSAIV